MCYWVVREHYVSLFRLYSSKIVYYEKIKVVK